MADVSRETVGRVESSRESLRGAGWRCEERGTYLDLTPRYRPDFSWLSPSTLWSSRNDVVAEYVDDPVPEIRRAWVERLGGAGGEAHDLVLDRHAGLDSFKFVFFGDPGEGDASQYALVPLLTAHERDAEFAFISSDVIYPAGGVNEYLEKFYRPYEDFPAPIYAVPGNHDWYDGLHGFAAHFCGADPYREPPRPRRGRGLRAALRDVLWRDPEEADPAVLKECRELRSDPRQRLRQPAPYFVLDAGPLDLVGIDQGIRGTLDREQGEWLRRVSRRSPKPKVLVLGKPIYADGEYHPREIEGGGTVDEMVRDPANNYVATVVGDKHNYQRYGVKTGGGRVIQHVVSGGGGAFTHATHKIPKVDLPGVSEEGFRCYPRRGDSLSYYSKLYDRSLGLGRGLLYVPPDEAAAVMARRLGIEPTREGDRKVDVSERSRRAAARVFPLPGQARGPLYRVFEELFDRNEPPLFKNYLRVEVSPRSLSISCVGVTGCLEHEQDPPVEDHVRIPL